MMKIAMAITLAFLLASLPLGAQTKYVVTELGGLGGTYTTPFGTNNLGQVVGTSHSSDYSTRQAFRTAPNRSINPSTDYLGTLGGSSSAGYAINDSCQVAGTSGTRVLGPF